MKKLILYGAGRDGAEAVNFFGSDNIYCFVDGNADRVGDNISGKEIISFEKLKKMAGNSDLEDKEVVITVGYSRWAVYTIAHQLRRIGIEKFSVYSDIKKRWNCGADYLNRDVTIYPCEQESVLEVYKYQLEWMLRHTSASDLKPAQGAMRVKQLDEIDNLKLFLELVSHLNLRFIMNHGTLIGAVRHRGFIPWDDDMDLCLMRDDYEKLLKFAEDSNQIEILYNCGNYNYRAKDGRYKIPKSEKKYLLILGRGYTQIFCNDEEESCFDNRVITDIIPIYYFRDDYSVEQYKAEHDYWFSIRKQNFDRADEEYAKGECAKNVVVDESHKVGYLFDWATFYSYHNASTRRSLDCSLWETKDLFPLQKMTFETVELWAPANPVKWLNQINPGMDIMAIPPKSVGISVHNKDSIFTEKY